MCMEGGSAGKNGGVNEKSMQAGSEKTCEGGLNKLCEGGPRKKIKYVGVVHNFFHSAPPPGYQMEKPLPDERV